MDDQRVEQPAVPGALPRFIEHLRGVYQRLLGGGPATASDPAAIDQQLQSLTLADAAIRYVVRDEDRAARPLQVAVLGPTQTGKSTLVNLLLGRRVAEVSPLAGFTVHPQGFWIGGDTGDAAWTTQLFPGWRRCPGEKLARDDLTSYALDPVPPPPVSNAPDALFTQAQQPVSCVVWDTPDFDSLAARRYARGVLEIAALADVYVLVLSKEKYSDLSVWRLLELVEPLARPLIICLNKLTPETEQVVTNSLRERLAPRAYIWGDVPIIPLPYDAALAAGDSAESAAVGEWLRRTLWERVGAEGGPSDGQRRAAGVRALIRRHWDGWLTPVRAEQETRGQWQRMVDQAATNFMTAYERDYLNHPQRYDSFRRASLELLNLLEIPAVGGVMTHVRQVLTWPARRLVSAGRAWWDGRRRSGRAVHSLGAEATVLIDTMSALLTGLERDVARRCVPATAGLAVWLALGRALDAQQARLLQTFDAAIHTHHEQVTREISLAASGLYAELSKQPTRLAALRTARATMDLGSILLAIKTGGLTPLDVVFAPAAFALTSLLMEGAAGLEMGRVARALKTRQRAAVQEQLVQKTLVRELGDLAGRLDDPALFMITDEELAAATRALEDWEAAR